MHLLSLSIPHFVHCVSLRVRVGKLGRSEKWVAGWAESNQQDVGAARAAHVGEV